LGFFQIVIRHFLLLVWLLASGYWLLASGFWLLASGFWLLASGFFATIANLSYTFKPILNQVSIFDNSINSLVDHKENAARL
jgi:hypothetical protein